MKSTLISKSSLFSANNIRLKKKNIHLKKITKYISKLKISLNEKSNSKKLNFLSQKNSLKKKEVMLFYTRFVSRFHLLILFYM